MSRPASKLPKPETLLQLERDSDRLMKKQQNLTKYKMLRKKIARQEKKYAESKQPDEVVLEFTQNHLQHIADQLEEEPDAAEQQQAQEEDQQEAAEYGYGEAETMAAEFRHITIRDQ